MKFKDAIRDALMIAMERDPNVVMMGVGIIDPRAVWGTMAGLLEKFGTDRVVEGPLSELALTGACVGMATLGLRPVITHHRIDFTLLTMDQIINHAAKWGPMFGHQQSVPMVMRAVVGRGWGNGPQHTQSHHALYSHVPGIKCVVPSTPADAKGLLAAAIEDPDPVIFIEHRWMHEDDAHVPEGHHVVPIGKAAVTKPGEDVTIVGVGPMALEALRAAKALGDVSAEVIDLRTTLPIDFDTIVASVKKTGRLVVADADWGPCGVAGEIIAGVTERAFSALRAAPRRIVWPQRAVPSSEAIEKSFYPGAKEIEAAALATCAVARSSAAENSRKELNGPF